MIGARHIPIPVPRDEAGPEIRLIDARAAELNEPRLREVVRATAGIHRGRRISLSYSFPLALLAWYDGPVGIGVERISPCEGSFADSTRTPSERRAASAIDAATSTTWLASSRQALANALRDALACASPPLEGPAAPPRGSAGPWRARALRVAPGFVAWVCWRVETR